MHIWLWAGFIALVLTLLAIDLFLINRKASVVSARKALQWTGLTIILSLAFGVAVYAIYDRGLMPLVPPVTPDVSSRVLGPALDPAMGLSLGAMAASPTIDPNAGLPRTPIEAVTMYLTGWMVEYALSLDNLFVILVIFRFFAVPLQFQHRVLFWGILGALVLRGVMIAAGAALLASFTWVNYAFGGILILTAFRMLLFGESPVDPSESAALKLAKRVMPVTDEYHGEKFFVRTTIAGKLVMAMTPLFLVLIVIETTDVLFAVDSIPAIFAITRDPFLVFTSNVFAIIGLRSLYFALAALMDKFRYLKLALVFVLMFVGVKMLVSHQIHIKPWVSASVIGGSLALGVIVSWLKPSTEEPITEHTPLQDLADAAEETWRKTRKWVILAVGVTIVLFGLIVGILPGVPGIPIMIVGLAILATEFIWARKILKKLKEEAIALKDKASRMMGISTEPPAGNGPSGIAAGAVTGASQAGAAEPKPSVPASETTSKS